MGGPDGGRYSSYTGLTESFDKTHAFISFIPSRCRWKKDQGHNICLDALLKKQHDGRNGRLHDSEDEDE